MVYLTAIAQQLPGSLKKYPNIPTLPGSTSTGSELPEFGVPNMVARPDAAGSKIAEGSVRANCHHGGKDDTVKTYLCL